MLNCRHTRSVMASARKRSLERKTIGLAADQARSEGHDAGYRRAREDLTRHIIAKPSEHVAIDPPKLPLLRVVVPHIQRFSRLYSDHAELAPYRVAEFRFQAECVRVDVGEYEPVVLTWWRPVFQRVT